MSHALILGIVLSATSFATHAADCYLILCTPEEDPLTECTVTPSRLSATLPAGLSISAIRGHTAIAPKDGDARYDRVCQKRAALPEAVSLDRGSLYGAVQIAGTLTANGLLRYEPNDGGTLAFLPEKALFAHTGSFFRKEFEMLKLDAAQPAPNLHPPRSLAHANCWTAQATLRATDFDLVVGDSSAAGNYVRRLTLTNVRNFRPCISAQP